MKKNSFNYSRIFSIFFFLCIITACSTVAKAQLLDKISKKAERKVKQATDRKVDRTMDKVINKADKKTDEPVDDILNGTSKENKAEGAGKAAAKSAKENNSNPEDISETGENEAGFRRGSRIIFQDDFGKDAVGDFPARWSSNKGGEVKVLKGFNEKFLRVPAGSVVNPELTKLLPENFTLELDVVLPAGHPYRRAGMAFGSKVQGLDYLLAPANAIQFDIMSAEVGNGYYSINYGTKSIGITHKKVDYKAPLDKKIHIAYEVNGKRIRMFVDNKKMTDLPVQFLPAFRKSFFISSITSGWKETKEAYFYFSNIVIAETGKDERSSVLKDLMEKGSVTTNAIQFASGSDVITSSGTDVVKDFADALNENKELRVRITGYTDGDGDAAKNLVLSKKRANAVKLKLAEMGISAGRLETEGKGESDPVADNNTEEGKAKNRRVQFTKIN